MAIGKNVIGLEITVGLIRFVPNNIYLFIISGLGRQILTFKKTDGNKDNINCVFQNFIITSVITQIYKKDGF